MYAILSWTNVVKALRWIPTLMDMLPWNIKNEKRLRNDKEIDSGDRNPYMFISKVDMPSYFWSRFSKQALVTMTICWTRQNIESDFTLIFEELENSMMWDIEWCLPIQSRDGVEVSWIERWYWGKPTRDEKWNLVLARDYVFTYIIHR